MAGFRAALEASDLGAKVVMTTKGLWGKDAGATWMAHDGYQCWGIHPDDSLDLAAEDTIRCGWFLNNQENVYTFLAHVPNTGRELLIICSVNMRKDARQIPMCSVTGK